jgi:hypothetical protein
MDRKSGVSFRKKLFTSDNSFGVAPPRILPYESEGDLREAVENFRAYLSILREWGRKERLDIYDLAEQGGQDPAID